ncbi:MAG TPA: ATP-binding protein, partial [Candidatus Thermoplasmatota archaeon]|nr:ATP-binding protein [Candidatus Thermoplasmatota archaeon]
YTLDVPAGASSLAVRFRADRAILQTATIGLNKDIEQELRIYDEQGGLTVAFPYYDPAAPEHLGAQAFSYGIDLPAGQPNVTVGWRFHDKGTGVGQVFINPVFGQSFSSTVQDATIEMAGIPLTPSVERERLGLQEDSVHYATTVGARVPDSLGVAGRISVTVRVAESLVFSHVLGPRGETIQEDLVQRSSAGDIDTVVLTGNATAAHGPGLYRLVFTTATPISPSPLLYPFIALVMVVPAGAGALAWRNTRKFRQQATPEFVTTATNLENVVLAMIAAYLLLPLGVLVSGRLSLMASWPLEGEAGLVYLLIGIAFVAFLAVGFVGRRHLNHVMLEEAAIKERARRELERSNRELAEFAYVASHDLQEPLRTVASYTQLLQRRYKGRLDQDADEFIDSAVEGAQRMQSLIQDLLQYSRVGAKPEPPTAVDLGSVLEGVRRTLRQSIAEANAELVVTRALPTIVAHERQFDQLMQNLVANAVKFRDPARPCRVEVSAEPVPGGWRVAVKDNGIGIDPRHSDRIFQIFQRLHAREDYPGTGIGLAICKRIVELNGGAIGVESTPGQGSTFWFTVPDRPLPPPGEASSAPADGTDGRAAA